MSNEKFDNSYQRGDREIHSQMETSIEDTFSLELSQEPNPLSWDNFSSGKDGRKHEVAYGQAIAEKNYIDAKLKETLKELSDIKFALDKAAILAITDGRGIISYVNDKFCELSKYSREELIGKTHRIIKSNYHPSEFFQDFWATIKAGKVWKGEFKNKAKDGTNYWVDTTIVPFVNAWGTPYQYLAIRFDISDRKQAEEALRETELKNRSLIGAIPDVMFRLNRQGIFLDYFPAKTGDTGQSSSSVDFPCPQTVNGKSANTADASSRLDFIGKSVEDVFPEGLAHRTRGYLEETLLTGEPQIHEYILALDGEDHHYEARYVPCGDREVLAIVRDVTERKQMEEALRISELQQREKALQIEKTLRELQQTQTQLIQAEKMSSLGQLVAGIAHEINNPVNFIYGNLVHTSEYVQNILQMLLLYNDRYQPPLPEIETAAEEMELDFLIEDLPKMVSSMKLGANRIREIVLSLRNFSRLDEAAMKAVDIHSGIESTLVILQNRLKAKPGIPEITLIQEYGNLPAVECYASQLNQVFMNLLANSIDALEEFAIAPKTADADADTTHPHAADNPTIWVRTRVVEESHAIVQISDNGPGIPESVQKRLFDPFFTTKPVGKGTGLGLSIAYHIVVEKHKGQLTCTSHPNSGTTFQISIPISQTK